MISIHFRLRAGRSPQDWSDGEIIRAIREGVDRDGHPLVIVPSNTLHNLSDADVQRWWRSSAPSQLSRIPLRGETSA